MTLKFIKNLRNYTKKIVEKHPLGIFAAEFFLRNFPIFLPHDDDYYGLCKLTNKKNGLFLDIGANDGRSVLSFHKLKKGWRIFSIEANSLHRQRLERIKSEIPNVNYIIRAVGRKGNLKLKLYTPIYYFYAMHTATSANLSLLKKNIESLFGKKIADKFKYKETFVTTIKIDDLKLSPDIVKIDVEGNELDVLYSCVKTIKMHSPSFLIEYNESNFSKIKSFFLKRRYYIYGFDSKQMKFAEFDEGRFKNCFFVPQKLKESLTGK